ncbi:MAG TPA: DUF6391 domain-containing protein [Chloroflexota bacterium]|nr:DUF6391 domain-containing protein [Chloroflexota bacterium]
MSRLHDMVDQVLLGKRVRQNHALEHATIALLSPRHPKVVFTGRSTANGFYVWGKVDADAIRAAAEEALEILRTREPEMAIHPRCGTNLAVASIMAGLSAVLAGQIPPQRNRYSRGVLASLLALSVAQPVGFFVQRHVTTLTPTMSLRVVEVVPTHSMFGSGHYVRTTHDPG